MDPWDFMEFSEISALLKNDRPDVSLFQLFANADSGPGPKVPASQTKSGSESCSSLTEESPASSPTSDPEDIGVSEHSPEITDENFEKLLNENHSKLMSESAADPLSSGNNSDRSSVSSSHDPIIYNTAASISSSSEADITGNFVQFNFTDVNELSPEAVPISRSCGRMEFDKVRFLEGSVPVVERTRSFPPIQEAHRFQSAFHTSDKSHLVKRSSLFPTSLQENMTETPDFSSDVSKVIKLRHGHTLLPTSYASSMPRQDTLLLDHNQSVMQGWKLPFPSFTGKDQLTIDRDSCRRKTFEGPSGVKKIIVQNQTPRNTPCLGAVFPIGNEHLCGMINEQIIKLPEVLDDSATKSTNPEPKSSVRCRSRSKPGFSTNPRSLSEKTRRKRITERLKELQTIVPKSVKGDNIVDMLDQTIIYVGNLEKQLQVLLMRNGNPRVIDANNGTQDSHAVEYGTICGGGSI